MFPSFSHLGKNWTAKDEFGLSVGGHILGDT